MFMGQEGEGGDEQQQGSVAAIRMTSYFSWYLIKTGSRKKEQMALCSLGLLGAFP